MNRLNTCLPIIHLKPGEVHFSQAPELVATVLGSCVSIIMYNPRFCISAICHSVLPGAREDCPLPGNDNKYKYLDTSFEDMYRWFIDHGVKHNEIIVKAFGGGNVMQIGSPYPSTPSVGLQNIDKALKLVTGKNLRFTSLDLGGECGRKLYFYTHTGEVMLKRLKKMDIENSAAIHRKKYGENV